MTISQTIECRGFRYALYLGCTPEERKFLQTVSIDLDVSLSSLSAPVSIDDRAQAIEFDYAHADHVMTERLHHKTFVLIESIGLTVLQSLGDRFPVRSLKVSVTKLPPGMPHVAGVSYVCEADFLRT